mgnify:CR=1 FL=1
MFDISVYSITSIFDIVKEKSARQITRRGRLRLEEEVQRLRRQTEDYMRFGEGAFAGRWFFTAGQGMGKLLLFVLLFALRRHGRSGRNTCCASSGSAAGWT